MRLMKETDKDSVFGMMRSFYDSPAVLTKSPDEVLKKDIDDCVGECPFIEGYVFEEDDMIAGYAMVAKSYSTEFGGICLWVEDLYVKPEYRGKGYSKEFFSEIEKLYGNKVVRYRLEAELENERAIENYKKRGYTVLPYVQFTKENGNN